MLKKYMLQHLRERLHEDKTEFFCVPFKHGTLRRMQSALRPSLPGGYTRPEQLQVPSFQVDLDNCLMQDMQHGTVFGDALRKVVFCHVVRNAPSKLVRVGAQGEAGFKSSDVVIALRRVLHVDGNQREVILESSSLDWVTQGDREPFILSLESFSWEDLLCMFKWQTADVLAHGLWGHEMPAGFGTAYADELSQLLQDLVMKHGDHGYELDVRQERGSEKKACVSAMEAAGLLQRVSEDDRFSKWLLLGKGEEAIKAGYCVRRPRAALAIREDVEASSRTVWELIAILDDQGWTHMIAKKNKSQDPYVPGSGPLLWYSKPGDDTICAWYPESPILPN